MKRTNYQNRILHGLLNRLKLTDQKAALVAQYTCGRTAKSSEMSQAECQALIDALSAQIQGTMQQQSADKMRKKIIALAHHEMGWAMADIDTFCQTKGYLKKGLNKYSIKELPTLVSQFEAIYQSYLKRLNILS